MLVAQTDFLYIDEDFAINSFRLKFLNRLMTGIIRIGVTERGNFRKYSEAVHIRSSLRLCIT